MRAARTAAPRTAPVSPSMPDGMSTARIGRPRRVEALDERRGARLEITVEPAAEQRVDDEPGPRRRDRVGERRPGRAIRRAARAASPRMRSAGPSSATATSWPRSARRRAATKPSPPLLPGPQTTRMPRPARASHRDGCIGHRCAGARHQRGPACRPRSCAGRPRASPHSCRRSEHATDAICLDLRRSNCAQFRRFLPGRRLTRRANAVSSLP